MPSASIPLLRPAAAGLGALPSGTASTGLGLAAFSLGCLAAALTFGSRALQRRLDTVSR